MPIKGHTKKGKYVNSHIHYDILYLLIAKNEDMNKIRILEEENSNVKWVKIDDDFSYELVDWIKAEITASGAIKLDQLNDKEIIRRLD